MYCHVQHGSRDVPDWGGEGLKERQTVRHTDGKLGLGSLQQKKPPHPGNKVCYHIELNGEAGLLYKAEWGGGVVAYNWTGRRGYCIQLTREARLLHTAKQGGKVFSYRSNQDLIVTAVPRRQS